MAGRDEKLRRTAARCLALAQDMADANARATLITMAQTLHEMASRPPTGFDGIVDFNNEQMLGANRRAVQQQQQQQQQTQPREIEE